MAAPDGRDFWGAFMEARLAIVPILAEAVEGKVLKPPERGGLREMYGDPWLRAAPQEVIPQRCAGPELCFSPRSSREAPSASCLSLESEDLSHGLLRASCWYRQVAAASHSVLPVLSP